MRSCALQIVVFVDSQNRVKGTFLSRYRCLLLVLELKNFAHYDAKCAKSLFPYFISVQYGEIFSSVWVGGLSARAILGRVFYHSFRALA